MKKRPEQMHVAGMEGMLVLFDDGPAYVPDEVWDTLLTKATEEDRGC